MQREAKVRLWPVLYGPTGFARYEMIAWHAMAMMDMS